jgi:hypothetical protein
LVVDVGFTVDVGFAVARVIRIRHIDRNLDRRRFGILVVVVLEIAVKWEKIERILIKYRRGP